jgi:hypothetical protein
LSAAQQAARSVKEFRRDPIECFQLVTLLFYSDFRFKFFRVSEANRASGRGDHGFEPRIVADAIQIGIDLGVIEKTYAHRAALSDKSTAMGVWIFYTFFVLFALRVEKRSRGRRLRSMPRLQR